MKTCMDCIFNCVAADKETCERFKDASLFGKEDKDIEKEKAND